MAILRSQEWPERSRFRLMTITTDVVRFRLECHSKVMKYWSFEAQRSQAWCRERFGVMLYRAHGQILAYLFATIERGASYQTPQQWIDTLLKISVYRKYDY